MKVYCPQRAGTKKTNPFLADGVPVAAMAAGLAECAKGQLARLLLFQYIYLNYVNKN